MANRITADCIGCGNCELACIYGAISASGDVYVIDPERCDGCASLPCGCRCVRICPTEAIVPLAASEARSARTWPASAAVAAAVAAAAVPDIVVFIAPASAASPTTGTPGASGPPAAAPPAAPASASAN